jgi:hypothetical protein
VRAVLDRYEEALRALKVPPLVSFTYSLEQAGARNTEQQHRVYRSGSLERDETLGVDGQRAARPLVRIYRGRPDRYEVDLVAPTRERYEFRLAATRRDGRHVDYVYRTTAKTSRAFSVTGVVIDGVRFLPKWIAFRAQSERANGQGAIEYALVGRYWLPVSALAQGTTAGIASRERIVFSLYRFPLSLPDSTFATQHEPEAAPALPLPAPSPNRAPLLPAPKVWIRAPGATPHRPPTIAPELVEPVPPVRPLPTLAPVQILPAPPSPAPATPVPPPPP